MVVPTIGIIPGDEDGSLIPFRQLLQIADSADEPCLLIERRRVTGVAILSPSCFQETNGRQITRRCGLPEIAQVVNVVGGAVISYFRHTGGSNVVPVVGALIELE